MVLKGWVGRGKLELISDVQRVFFGVMRTFLDNGDRCTIL